MGATFWEQHGEFVRRNPRGARHGREAHTPDSFFSSLVAAGGGYWLWKPFLIAQTLREMPYGAVLAYVDLGCIVNARGRERFLEYVELVRSTPPHVLSTVPADPTSTDSLYCKPDVLAHFGLSVDGEVATARQRKATFMLVHGTTLHPAEKCFGMQCHGRRCASSVQARS